MTVDLFGTLIEPVERGAIHDKRRAAILHEFGEENGSVSRHNVAVAYSDAERYIESSPLLSCASSEQTRHVLLESLSLSHSVENQARMGSALSTALAGAFRVLPEAHEFIDELRQSGLKVAVVTNVEWESRADVENILDELRLEVDAVVTSTTVGYFKPRPEPFVTAADALGVSPGELMHVGDDYVADYLGACAAGLSASLLSHRTNNFDSRHILEFDSFAALLPYVLSTNRSSR